MKVQKHSLGFINKKAIWRGFSLVMALPLLTVGVLGQGNGAVNAEEFPWPTSPPTQVCSTQPWNDGPTTAPTGAITVPAGNNESFDFRTAGATYWFAPGVHTLGTTPYGQIIPANNTTFIGAPGAILDGQNLNLFAFTENPNQDSTDGITIRYLEIRNFGTGTSNNDQGTVNHDSGENWTVEYNYVHNNDGAGVFLGSGSVTRYNCLKDNGQYGFSSYHPDGISDVVLAYNEVVGNNQDDWESLREGCGCTGGGKFWETDGAVIKGNWVHDNMGTGVWADFNNRNFLIEENLIENNDGIGIFYEISYNFMIRHNSLIGNAVVEGKVRADAGDAFPSAAIYISESGGDSRAGSEYNLSEIKANYFENNWDGVALWENADRFCRPNEPGDTTNMCPFFDQTWGKRFKTQNILISENVFKVDKTAINCTNAYCGRQAVFSNYGTYPANSPYLGNVIQEAVTYQQNNVWQNNAYVGPWRFMPYETSNNVSFLDWQATPYNQDASSTFDGDMGSPTPPDPGTPPPATLNNYLDDDTASIENSVGEWQAWYSSAVTHSTDEAHSGTHSLKVDITSGSGWGVNTTNFPGFTATPGLKEISLWGKLGNGTNAQPILTIKWLDSSQTVLQTDTVTLPTLTSTWQNAKVIADAPAGTATALVRLTGDGATGEHLYLDDIYVGDAPNILDADTANLENSIGQWAAWYSANVSTTTEDAKKGMHSLKVEVTAPWGWAMHLNNWPGFAASAGAKKVSYWAKSGMGSITDITMRIKWLDASGVLLQTDVLPVTLTANWQQATSDVTAPAGTTHALVEYDSDFGNIGDTAYIDNIVITN